MAITTYAELQTAASNWLHRDDLTTRIPEFITLGEARLNRELRSRDQITSATVNPSQVNAYVSLPTGWNETVSFNDDLGEPMEEVAVEHLEDLRYSTSGARPRYYAITSRIEFERVADSAYNYTMQYYKNLDLATDLTNNVLTKHPDVYLYATLLASAPFLKDDNRIMVWEQTLQSVLRSINNKDSRTKRELRTEFGGESFNIIRGY